MLRIPADVKIGDRTLQQVLDEGRDRVDLHKADLREANLNRVNLSGANLYEADLRGANLNKAILNYANLNRADLHGATLYEANLYGANLTEANLSETNLTEACLVGITIQHTVLPTNLVVATLCFGDWPATITPTFTVIGCQQHPNEKWLEWEPEDQAIQDMDAGAEEMWRKYRDVVRAVIRKVMEEATKCTPT